MKLNLRNSLRKILGTLTPLLSLRIYRKLLKIKPLKWCAVRIIRFVVPHTIILPEGRLILNKNDLPLSGRLSVRMYEPLMTKLIRSHTQEGMVVVDIGANIGYYTLIFAGRVGVKGNVFSYEPEKTNFCRLQENIAENKLTNTQAFQTALGDKVETRFLYLSNNSSTHSLGDNSRLKNPVKVSVETLDDSLRSFDNPPVDIIKMDVEGAELLALEGMRKTLARSPHLVLFTEFYPKGIEKLGGSPLEFLNTLRACGFSISIIDEERNKIVPLTDFKIFMDGLPDIETAYNLYAVKK